MEKIVYEQLNETLYRETLDNGLEVYLLPKYGFSKSYATFTTNFGSIDVHIEGKPIPLGVAHFLEHQLFQTDKGDITEEFSKNGANVNAFTSYDKTSYVFSCTTKLRENIELLLDFVQTLEITNESVEKERGIIHEELQMYADNPEFQLMLHNMKGLFKEHPLKDDIGGTLESIKEITKETLLESHNYFYNPKNMTLVIVGSLEPEELIQTIRENQAKKDFTSFGEFKRHIPYEDGINEKEINLVDEDSFEKASIGFKQGPEFYQGNYEKFRLSMMIYLDILFGKSSENYEELFKNQLINYSFGPLTYVEPLYSVILIGGDTRNPDLFVETVKNMLTKELDYEQFVHMKNKFYGSMMRMLNYPEAIANEFTAFRFANSNLFNVISIVNSITFEDVKRCKEFFKEGTVVKMKRK